jgi:hypothetical protein
MSTDPSLNTAESPETISGQNETQATTASERSLREELAAALDLHESSDTPEGPVATEATTEQVAAEPATETPAVQAQEAPQHWPAEKREVFAKLPREAQDLVLERHKEMEADYTRKTMELAEQRKPLDEFTKLFEPAKQRLELAGLTPAQVTRQLLAAQSLIETNPVEGLKWLAQSYKVDLSTLVAPKEDEYVDPAYKALRDEVNQLKSQLSQRDIAVQRQNAEAVQKTITDFASSKNADGTAKYPHFDNLRNLMGPLVNEGKTLEQAYELASYTLPEVRERIASEAAKAAQAEALKRAEDERKQKAKDVKGAAQVIRSRGTASEPTKGNTTLRQELENNLRALTSGRI